eukprot:gene42425-62451_t
MIAERHPCGQPPEAAYVLHVWASCVHERVLWAVWVAAEPAAVDNDYRGRALRQKMLHMRLEGRRRIADAVGLTALEVPHEWDKVRECEGMFIFEATVPRQKEGEFRADAFKQPWFGAGPPPRRILSVMRYDNELRTSSEASPFADSAAWLPPEPADDLQSTADPGPYNIIRLPPFPTWEYRRSPGRDDSHNPAPCAFARRAGAAAPARQCACDDGVDYGCTWAEVCIGGGAVGL